MDIDYTVKRVGRRQSTVDALGATYILTIATLPDRRWKWGYDEMKRELMVTLGVSGPEARNILFNAYLEG